MASFPLRRPAHPRDCSARKHGRNNARLNQIRDLQLEHEHCSADSQSNHLVAIDCKRDRRGNGLAPE
jgi:hypothetical protein